MTTQPEDGFRSFKVNHVEPPRGLCIAKVVDTGWQNKAMNLRQCCRTDLYCLGFQTSSINSAMKFFEIWLFVSSSSMPTVESVWVGRPSLPLPAKFALVARESGYNWCPWTQTVIANHARVLPNMRAVSPSEYSSHWGKKFWHCNTWSNLEVFEQSQFSASSVFQELKIPTWSRLEAAWKPVESRGVEQLEFVLHNESFSKRWKVFTRASNARLQLLGGLMESFSRTNYYNYWSIQSFTGRAH